MKRILITGANSYIGTSFETYIKTNYPADYVVDTVDMLDGSWRERDFSGYDSVFHVAGIAHQKETKENAPLYYEINRDLAIETAQKAKREGVRQFIFFSSMSVYGMNTGVITRDTVPTPKSHYGKSKLAAEEGLKQLATSSFCVTILRPPMVYGKGCRGNFQTILKIAKKSPVFPRIKNQRSMIYIENLCCFAKKVVDMRLDGIYCPQNEEYMETRVIAQEAAKAFGKKVYFSYLLGAFVWILRFFLPIAQKAFGNLVYEKYDLVPGNTLESIKKSI